MIDYPEILQYYTDSQRIAKLASQKTAKLLYEEQILRVFDKQSVTHAVCCLDDNKTAG